MNPNEIENYVEDEFDDLNLLGEVNEENINVNFNDEVDELIAIEWAIESDDLEFISNIQDHIPNRLDDKGTTPYQLAMSPEMVNLLVEKGVDINATDINGNTALFSQLNTEIVQTLINNKIDFTIKNNEGKTAQDHNLESLDFYSKNEMYHPLMEFNKLKQQIIQEKIEELDRAYDIFKEEYEKVTEGFKQNNMPLKILDMIDLDDKFSLQYIVSEKLGKDCNLPILYKKNLINKIAKMGLKVDKDLIKEIVNKVNNKFFYSEKEVTITSPSAKDLAEAGPSWLHKFEEEIEIETSQKEEIEIETSQKEEIEYLKENQLSEKAKNKNSWLKNLKAFCIGPNLTDEQEDAKILAWENIVTKNRRLDIANKDKIEKENNKKLEDQAFAKQCLQNLALSNITAENIKQRKTALYTVQKAQKQIENSIAINKQKNNYLVAEIENKKSALNFSNRRVLPSTSKDTNYGKITNQYNECIGIIESLSKAPDVPLEAIIDTLPHESHNLNSDKKSSKVAEAIKETTDKKFVAETIER